MQPTTSLVKYCAALLLVGALLLAAPGVGAAPEASRLDQTVPSRTPRPTVGPTSVPPTIGPTSGPPPATQEPPATTAPGQPTATPTPPVTPTGTVGPAKLALYKQVSSGQAWPGATLVFTLTLINSGGAAAQEIVLTDPLPAGLDPLAPVTATEGTTAAWDGRTLRATAAMLPPAGRLVVTFRAVVRADVAAGAVLVNTASASAAGDLRATASAAIALPPAELPPTGGRPDHALSVATPAGGGPITHCP